MKRNGPSFWLFAVLVLCFTLISANGFGQDRKTYHGTTCQGLAPFDRSMLENRVAGIENFHGTLPAFVMCPIIRDNANNTTGFDGPIWVRVFRSSATTQRLHCWVSTINVTGVRIRTANASWVGNGWQWLALNTSGAGASVAWGSALLYCSLPPGSRLLSYTVDELPNTNN